MPSSRAHHFLCLSLALCLAASVARTSYAEDEDRPSDQEASSPGDEAPPPPPRRKKPKRREYVTDTDHGDRSDAGIFHVAFAGGGNFYVEPQEIQQADGTQSPSGQYFKDFGFQAGVYFDYDYSEMEENIPLLLRGMVGYKYILSSVNVFTFDAVAARVFRFSEGASFLIGLGGSAAVWYRTESTTAPISAEQIIFLPSFIIDMGFNFNPFMVDFKWLINKFGDNDTITGLELYFGFRI